MDKAALCAELMQELRRMNRLNVMRYLREFAEGETAVLDCVYHYCGSPTPTAVSEELNLSRTRTANVLHALKKKGYIAMSAAKDDRRKAYISVTAAGVAALEGKYKFLGEYLQEYIGVMGEENTRALTALLKITADSEKAIYEKFSAAGAHGVQGAGDAQDK